jgi:hypothetical protein
VSPVLVPPPDVVVARTLRSLTRALLVCCAAALGLGVLSVTMLALADPAADLASGLVLLGVGQAGALAGAGVVGAGLRRVVAGPTSQAPRLGATPQDAAAAEAVRAGVSRRLALVTRGLLVTCVLVSAGWTLVDPAAGLGALVGALVAGQVAVALLVLRRLIGSAPATGSTSATG